jgi:hypothetical protein
VNLLVLDESLELAVQIGRLASLRGWQPHFVGLLHELEVAVGARGRPALIVVNRQPPLTAWDLGQWLRGRSGCHLVSGVSPLRWSTSSPSGEAPPVTDCSWSFRAPEPVRFA